mmetsp:Transcript_41389/g.99134  ORF Transcript_41389/g.99134 Transcript_41389/m.99134 type:complete len:233 (+) Transcript_41389:516-1214(+)
MVATVTGGIFHSQFHTAFTTDTRRGDHIVSIGVGGVSDEFGIDLCTTLLGMFQFFQDDHTTSTGNDESITGLVEGTGRMFRILVPSSRQGTHTIEHTCELPVNVLTCTTEGDVTLVQLDLFEACTDTVSTCTACTGDRVRRALNFEVCCKDGTACRSHRPCNTEGSDLVLPPLSTGKDGITSLDDVRDRCTTLSDDGSDTWVLLVLFWFQSRILDGSVQGDVGVLCVRSHEP